MKFSTPNPPARNLRLDFFRGIALMIIFINHMPQNELFFYTPSRFGLSDAAETFVFLSGFAAALAYGRGFEQSGLGLGALRIVLRCGRIYTAQLGLFVGLAAICVVGRRLGADDYIQRLNFNYFFDQTQDALFDLVTLRYVPMYLDVLPMYLVVMLWIPLVWGLSRLRVALALALPVLIYGAAQVYGWDLPADPQSDRVWFFNPFAWQFMFFTGFAFGAGWLRPPRPSRAMIALAVSVLIVGVPLGHEPTFRHFGALLEWRLAHEYLVDKTHLGILRWGHFLALAFLMNHLMQRNEHWLRLALPRWVAIMGRQSLPMFLLGVCFSYIGGMALDGLGHDLLTSTGVSLAGLALLLMAARGLDWLDTKPWRVAVTVARLTPRKDAAMPGTAWVGERWRGAVLAGALVMLLSMSPWLLLLQERPPSEIALVEHGKQPGGDEADPGPFEWQDGI